MPLLSATRKAAVLAPPLPVRNAVFQQGGIAFRRRQFSLVVAAPGVGKTLVATNMAIRTPVSTLYFSADSDEWTVKQRACSILCGTPLSQVEQQLSGDDEGYWEQYYTDWLRTADHIDWCFQSDIEPEFIVNRLFAYAELRGDFPELIIVDNLGDMVEDQDNEGSELRSACRELKRIARTTGAHVMGLHHVVGPKENGDKPIYLGDLIQKIGKVGEVVLGLYRDGPPGDGMKIRLTVPKQRGGRSGMDLPLPINYSTAIVEGFAVQMAKDAA